jgi:hypothetical protein
MSFQRTDLLSEEFTPEYATMHLTGNEDLFSPTPTSAPVFSGHEALYFQAPELFHHASVLDTLQINSFDAFVSFKPGQESALCALTRDGTRHTVGVAQDVFAYKIEDSEALAALTSTLLGEQRAFSSISVVSQNGQVHLTPVLALSLPETRLSDFNVRVDSLFSQTAALTPLENHYFSGQGAPLSGMGIPSDSILAINSYQLKDASSLISTIHFDSPTLGTTSLLFATSGNSADSIEHLVGIKTNQEFSLFDRDFSLDSHGIMSRSIEGTHEQQGLFGSIKILSNGAGASIGLDLQGAILDTGDRKQSEFGFRFELLK